MIPETSGAEGSLQHASGDLDVGVVPLGQLVRHRQHRSRSSVRPPSRNTTRTLTFSLDPALENRITRDNLRSRAVRSRSAGGLHARARTATSTDGSSTRHSTRSSAPPWFEAEVMWPYLPQREPRRPYGSTDRDACVPAPPRMAVTLERVIVRAVALVVHHAVDRARPPSILPCTQYSTPCDGPYGRVG